MMHRMDSMADQSRAKVPDDRKSPSFLLTFVAGHSVAGSHLLGSRLKVSETGRWATKWALGEVLLPNFESRKKLHGSPPELPKVASSLFSGRAPAGASEPPLLRFL